MNIIARHILLSLKKNFTYKINTVFVVIDELFEILGIWIFWLSLLELQLDIPGWNEKSIFTFLGFSLISSGVSAIFVGVWSLSDHILQGTLDKYLVKPSNPIILILLERANFLRVLIDFTIGLAIIIWNAGNSGMLEICACVFMCVCASLTLNLVFLIIYQLSFWLKKTESLADFFYTLAAVRSYPIVFFSGKVAMVLTYVIPVAFIGTIPTEILLGHGMKESLLLALASPAALVLLVVLIWKLGRNRYESAN